MKKFFHIILISLIVVVILFTGTMNSFAASHHVIDGIVSFLEWQGCVTDVLAYNTSQSENSISFASIKTRRIDDNTLMLAYCCTDGSEDGYIDDCKVRLSISGVGTYDFGVDHSTTFSENDLLKIDWETSSRSNNFFIEMRLVFKSGIADNLFFYTFIRDGKSNLSKRFCVTNIARKQTETTVAASSTAATTITTTEKTYATEAVTTKFYADVEASTTVKTTNNKKTTTTTTEEIQSSEFFIESSDKAATKAKIIKIVGVTVAVLLILSAALILINAGRTKKSNEEE